MQFTILKMIATSCFLTALECTKFIFDQSSAPDPAREPYSAPPNPLAGLRGTRLLTGEGKKGGDSSPIGNSWCTSNSSENFNFLASEGPIRINLQNFIEISQKGAKILILPVGNMTVRRLGF